MGEKADFGKRRANIRVLQDGHDQGAASGSFYFDDYDKYGYVVQKWVDTPLFSGQLPTLGFMDGWTSMCRHVYS